ncbi:hypothetical protein TWF481_008666 [Arthrobotrys musiformis]|uniref:Uncharacterized protein n=1 Tax=Arthrobotrys musiformis TaxID=47236 RepID=A0AAV9W7Z9_9PEZI
MFFVYAPGDTRTFYFSPASIVSLSFCTSFLIGVVISLGWICSRRGFGRKSRSKKARDEKGRKVRTAAEFRRRVVDMMRHRQDQAAMAEMERQRIEREKEEDEELNREVQEEEAVLKRNEGGKKDGQTTPAGFGTDSEDGPLLLQVIRLRMKEREEKRKADAEKKREGRNKLKKDSKMTKERKRKEKEQKKLDKKEAKKKKLENLEDLRDKVIAEWDASVAAVKELEDNRDRPVPRRELRKGRRHVPRIY